jgi:serine/threonine protein kinase
VFDEDIYRLVFHLSEFVSICEHRTTYEKVVVTRIPLQNSAHSEIIGRFMSGVEIHARLQYPSIQRFVGFALPCGDALPVIATEFAARGSLKKCGSELTGPMKLVILLGVAKALSHMHGLGIVHRNICPANVLVDEEWRPKVGRFSFAVANNGKISGQAGSPWYAAPEMYEEGGYTEKVDIFAYALLMYEVLTGRPAFSENLRPLQVMKRVVMGRRPAAPEGVIGRLVERCWACDPGERPSAEQIARELGNLEGLSEIPRLN